MKKLSLSSRKCKIITLMLAMTMVLGMAITAQASWYGFVNPMPIVSEGDTVLYTADFVGNNVGCNVWTSVDTAHSSFNGRYYTLTIQKKGWWWWQWDTVAQTSCQFGQEGSLNAYNVGDGQYRFVISTGLIFTDGVYADSFEAFSWD